LWSIPKETRGLSSIPAYALIERRDSMILQRRAVCLG
jgi:hypothetical protein